MTATSSTLCSQILSFIYPPDSSSNSSSHVGHCLQVPCRVSTAISLCQSMAAMVVHRQCLHPISISSRPWCRDLCGAVLHTAAAAAATTAAAKASRNSDKVLRSTAGQQLPQQCHALQQQQQQLLSPGVLNGSDAAPQWPSGWYVIRRSSGLVSRLLITRRLTGLTRSSRGRSDSCHLAREAAVIKYCATWQSIVTSTSSSSSSSILLFQLVTIIKVC